MKLKNFIQENNVSGFEIIPNVLIFNVIVGETAYQLDIETNNIQCGTKLIKILDYELNEDNDILVVDNISLNTNEVSVIQIL
jgi:hypothetical protein